jgi:proprotein convertase subtilisin/kexin type 5
MFRPCHAACVDCLGPSSTVTTNCNETLCVDGYHPMLTDKTNCLDDLPEGFYLAPPSADDIQYITPCYDTCKKCSTKGDEDDHKCIECKDTYFKVEGTNWNCWNDETKDDDYYLDSSNPDNKIYRKCYDRCATCQKGFTQDSHNCDTCIENHYFKHDTKDCAFDKDPTVDEYFGNKTAHYLEKNPTDDKLSVWKPCHTTCQICSNGLDGDNHNCDSCITGHKFIYGTKNCVDQPPQYYYDDTPSIYFMPCHESCETCKGSEREDCIMCRYTDFYYPTEETLLDDTKRCYNGSKDYDNSPGDDYYLDKNENELEGVYRKC